MLEVTAINHETQINPGQMAPLIQGQPKSPLCACRGLDLGPYGDAESRANNRITARVNNHRRNPGHRKEKAPRVNKPLTGMDLNELRFLIAEESQ